MMKKKHGRSTRRKARASVKQFGHARAAVPDTSTMGNESLVRYEIDPANLPRLTPEQEAEIVSLREKNDDNIDYSEALPLDDKCFQGALRNRFVG